MAFDATKAAFEPRITNNEFNELANITGKVYDKSNNEVDMPAGLLCVKSANKLPCEGFTSVYNENAWAMVVADPSATIPIYACNTYDVQLLNKNGNNWAVGTETLGLGVPAGRYACFTIIVGDGQHFYRFGEGNITDATTPTAGDVYIPDGAGGLEQGSLPTAGSRELYFEVVGVGTFTKGTQASFNYMDVVAYRA